MKTIPRLVGLLLAAAMVGVVAAAPPNAPSRDAHEFYAGATMMRDKAHRSGGSKWTAYALGGVEVPWWTWLTLQKPLEVDFRTPLFGSRPLVRGMPGFSVEQEMKWALMVRKAPNNPRNWNGNFSQHVRDILIECNKRSGGIQWGAGQHSEIFRLSVQDVAPDRWGIEVASGSTGWEIRGAEIECTAPHKQQTEGNGIHVFQSRSGVLSASVVGSEVGLKIRQGGANDAVLRFERVSRIELDSTTANTIHIDWDKPGDTPLIFSKDKGANALRITFRNAPRELFYEVDGRRLPFPADFAKSGMHQGGDGRTVLVETTWFQEEPGKARKRFVHFYYPN